MKKNSPEIEQYFQELNTKTETAYDIAKAARKLGYDPAFEPEVAIAKNMEERVVGLVSILAPQMADTEATTRIVELEKEYGKLDWRVAFQIALEVAQQKFCEFEDEREAMEVGIRTGFAYATNGVVSSPLEGFVRLELKDRLDGKGKYFCIYYSGPIRNAGGTAASVSVLIADYVRKHMGYEAYDPTEEEIKRCPNELNMYHERVTNLQYFPSEGETEFMMSNLPVEVAGDPTEKVEVSNYKNLKRIPTNRVRGGYVLVMAECLPQKAPKLWKQLGKWGNDMGMEQWNFLEEFLEIQKKAKAAGKKTEDKKNKLSPDYTYIKDLVAGRPVFAHPMKPGGFRLRYGRSRLTGLSGQALHPATMIIANEFIATGSQLKLERPGKAAAYTACNELDGPIVRLKNGDVVEVTTQTQARKLKDDVDKILYLGDVLINYGDFLNRAHVLAPPGYCEEWWVQELEKANPKIDKELLENPITTEVSFDEALKYSKVYGVPLHPKHTFFYALATTEQLRALWESIRKASNEETLKLANSEDTKHILEVIGVPHTVEDDKLVFTEEVSKALRSSFSRELPSDESVSPMECIQTTSPVFLRDKAGVFIGARLGRPEKAKMRKLTGSPHTLFPVGNEGGRLRAFNEAIDKKGKVTSSFEIFFCRSCDKETVTRRCPTCEEVCEERYVNNEGITTEQKEQNGVENRKHKVMSVPIREYLDFTLKRMQTRVYPDLIKGVRGTWNPDHTAEHFTKGVLRARHDVYVNKDGTVRYDASEVPITHFTPKEVGISAAKAKELGYVKDIHGRPIEHSEQVLELFPQDVVLPACEESPDEKSDDVLLRTAQFIDELLVHLYGLEPYYNAKTPGDLVGQLVIALAPHTSAGTIGRIIGFSKTQGLFYHPYLHCATRRDCDGDEGCVFLALDAFLNFSKRYLPSSRGGTMDAPIVLTTVLEPAEVDDMVFDMDIEWRYPLEFYEACQEWKMPWEFSMKKINDVLGKPEQFQGIGFTHGTKSMNAGNHCSAYKTLPSMQEKLESQMNLAEKLMAVDERDVAKLVITKHFIRDLKGNLRKFSMQTFRCVKCNEKFRRPPLRGNCGCGGRIIFTISEGSVVKYLTPAESLIKKYNLDHYLTQDIELTRRRVEEVFGRDPEKQLGLGEWF